MTSVGIWGGSVFVWVGAMELAHSKYNKMDRERGTNGMSRQREGREEAVCQGRRAALFL